MRHTLWRIATVASLLVAIASCSAPSTPKADDGSPEGVRVQHYKDPRPGGKDCLVFTHDTFMTGYGSAGASIAVVC